MTLVKHSKKGHNMNTQLQATVAGGMVDPSAFAAAEAARARIQAAYTIAIQQPRDELDCRAAILHACSRKSFADKAIYSKPVGGKAIKGPSIRFAEHALRCWKNIDVQTCVVYEDDAVRRVSVRVVDLENNSSFGKDIQIKKTVERKRAGDREVVGQRENSFGQPVFIVKATEDELLNKENAQISKVIRNEGLRLIPDDIVTEAMEHCSATIQKDTAADPDAALKKICDAFAEKLHVSPSMLAAYLKHPVGQCSPAEIENLRMVYSAIADGSATWADYMDLDRDDDADGAEAASQETLKGIAGRAKAAKDTSK